jgi:malonyl-CoA O-methyltransferase
MAPAPGSGMTQPGADDTAAAGGSAIAPVRSDTVRRQFDRRAPRFAEASVLVREAGQRLLERLSYIKVEARTVLDLGCGQGPLREALLQRFAGANWIGVDLSEAMLAQPSAAPPSVIGRLAAALRPRERGLRVCADAQRLPLADRSVDLVFSNLMLNWHPAPHLVLPELARVLKDGGLLLFTSLGPDTLRELRAACAGALAHARPMAFVDMHDLGDMMVASGFAEPVLDAETLRLTYGTARQLIGEVRALGGNPRDDRHRALPSGRSARELLRRLEAGRDADGRIGLTFEINYGLGWKAPERARVAPTTSIPVDAMRRLLRRG